MGIFLEAGVKDGVGDVVAEFVRVSAGHAFGGEEEMAGVGR